MKCMNKLVIDTSSGLFFTKIGLIPILLKKFKIITSEQIYQEIVSGDEAGFKDANILLRYVSDRKIDVIKTKRTQSIVNDFKIKEADASVVALAQEENCFLATEDRQIEKICLLTQTKITNTALLIFWLWQNKIFDDEQVFLLIDLLIRNGYNKEISLKIKEKILGGKKCLKQFT